MFTNTIDKKKFVTDNNGNQLVDLAASIFSKSAAGLNSYQTVKLTSHYQMRPDKVAFAEYGTDEYTEYILKYSGVSNPFSIDEDDVLFIPDPGQAEAQMKDVEDEKTEIANQVQTYYKFTNTDFKSNSKSYDNLANKVIPKGTPQQTANAGFTVPYISDEGTAITIKNGRMYFGTDAGNIAYPGQYGSNGSNIDSQGQYGGGGGNIASPEQYAKELATKLDEKCIVNGMSLTDFVRASIVNAGK